MNYKFAKLTGSSAIALAALWATAAIAQDAVPVPAAPSAADTAAEGGFQDIIVTARRREERLQDVPVAATALTSADLARYQSNSFQQIAAQTPQIQIGDSSNASGAVINLRGVGSPSAGPTIDNAVSINIDGVQFSQSQVLRLGLYDINRVEILKGPQALFYGKNSPGGVISITSNGPTKSFEGSIRAGYEFANKRKYVEATVSGPLSDIFGARLDATYGNQSGWYRNDSKPIPAVPVPAFLGGTGQLTDAGYGSTQHTGPDQEDYSVRGTLSFAAPGGFVDGTVKASYSKVDRNNGAAGFSNQFAGCPLGAPQYVVFLGSAGSRDCKLDRTYNEVDAAPSTIALVPAFGKKGGKQYFINEQFLTSATINFHLTDNLTLTSVTGYYKLDEVYTGNFGLTDLDFVQTINTVNIKQFSQEVRLLSSFSSPINFMVGGYYQNVDNQQSTIAIFGSPLIEAFTGGFVKGYNIVVNNSQNQKTDAYSVFGQAIFDVTSQVQLTAGGRYSHERKSVSGISLTPQTFTTSVFNVPYGVPERSFNNFSPEITATYKPVTNITLYAAYRTAFKSGGFDLNGATIAFGATSVGDVSFDQEKVKGFEVGAKGKLFDRQVIFDIAAFRFKYTGLQVSAFDSGTLGYRVTNAASAIVQGVELSAQFRPNTLPGLSLRGSINYDDAHYDVFANAPCFVGQSIAAGCAFTTIPGTATVIPIGPANPVGTLQNLTGRPLVRAPKWTGNIGATYDYEVSNDWVISTSADGIYSDSFYASAEEDIRGLQKNAWRLNAAISLRGPSERWEVSLIGTNLTQVLRAQQGYGIVGTGAGTGTAAALPNDFVVSPSEARTISLQAVVKF